MTQLYQIRLPNGCMVAPGDYTGAEPLWSTVEVGTAAFTVVSAFSYGRGGDVPGSIGPRTSNYADTNLEGEGNMLPENEEIFVYVIGIEAFMLGAEDTGVDAIPPSAAPDVSLENILRLQRDLLIETRIGTDAKRYTHAPLSWFPGGTGVEQWNAGAITPAGTGYMSGNNGLTSSFDSRQLASPLHVEGGETLTVDFRPGPGSVVGLNLDQTPAAGTVVGRVRLRVFLDGLRRRPMA
jgi:hypothetical protein